MSETGTATDKMRSFLVLIATAAVIGFNVLASTGYLNGVLTSEVSDRYPTVLTPAGFAFTIWSVIYLGLAAFSVYQLLPSKMVQFRPVRTIYVLSCLLNCLWLWFWHQYMVIACALVIVALWGSLLVLNWHFRTADTFVDALLTKGVFGLYFGWVTAAVLVNIMIALTASGIELPTAGWSGIGVVFLLLAAAAAILARFRIRNFLFPLAIAWAATGIGVKQSGNTLIVVACAIAVIVGLVMAISFVMDKKSTFE